MRRCCCPRQPVPVSLALCMEPSYLLEVKQEEKQEVAFSGVSGGDGSETHTACRRRLLPGAEGQRRGRRHALRAAGDRAPHVHHAAQARATPVLRACPHPLLHACMCDCSPLAPFLSSLIPPWCALAGRAVLMMRVNPTGLKDIIMGGLCMHAGWATSTRSASSRRWSACSA